MKHFFPLKQRGFTLIELLVVIVVVGILATALVTILNPIEQIAKSNDARRKTDLAAVQTALEQYYQDNGSYPQSADGQIIGSDGQEIIWGSGAFGTYMTRLPQDPKSGKTYAYFATASGDSFWLFASLDRPTKDPQACNKGNVCGKATQVSCGSLADSICTYGISSPNVSPN